MVGRLPLEENIPGSTPGSATRSPATRDVDPVYLRGDEFPRDNINKSTFLIRCTIRTMTWRTPVISLATALSIVAFGQREMISNPVLGDDSSTLLSPLAGTENLPTYTPTPIEEPIPTPTPKPTRQPTPTPKPQPQFSAAEISGFTDQYGILYGVDANVVRHVVLCESGLNPAAKNGPYAGLFQFDARTWQIYRVKMGLSADPNLRYHAEEAVKTGTYVLSLQKTGLWPNCYPR